MRAGGTIEAELTEAIGKNAAPMIRGSVSPIQEFDAAISSHGEWAA